MKVIYDRDNNTFSILLEPDDEVQQNDGGNGSMMCLDKRGNLLYVESVDTSTPQQPTSPTAPFPGAE